MAFEQRNRESFWVSYLQSQPPFEYIISKIITIQDSVNSHLICFLNNYSTQKMVEINFLCVHKKLRSKRVAPVLIREITRRVHLKGIFQAVYTAGVVLPKPVSTCRYLSGKINKGLSLIGPAILILFRYWHRSLNPKKLIDVKFSHLARNMTMQRTLKLYRLPEETKTPGFRTLELKDIEQAYRLLNTVSLHQGLSVCVCYVSSDDYH